MSWKSEEELIMTREKEIKFLNSTIKSITKERNMYRSQALMRMNKIKELENELQICKKSFNTSP